MSAMINEIISQFDYSSAVMTRFLNPHHAGEMGSSTNVRTAHAGSRERGASIRLYLQLKDIRVVQSRFVAYGCPHFLAAAEMLCEWCEGRSISELSQWNWQSLQSALEIPSTKRGKLLLLEDVIRKVVTTTMEPVPAAVATRS